MLHHLFLAKELIENNSRFETGVSREKGHSNCYLWTIENIKKRPKRYALISYGAISIFTTQNNLELQRAISPRSSKSSSLTTWSLTAFGKLVGCHPPLPGGEEKLTPSSVYVDFWSYEKLHPGNSQASDVRTATVTTF